MPSPRGRGESPLPRPSPATVPDSTPNALLVFPSEAPSRSQSAPIVNEAAPRSQSAPLGNPARSRSHSAPSPNVAERVARKSSALLAPRLVRPLLVVAAVLVVATLAALAIRRVSVSRSGGAAPQAGRLTIDTRPAAAEVLIDGERRGLTPLTLSLSPGAHSIAVRNGRDERVVPLTIAAGADVTQYFDMKTEPAVVSGRVSITTDPPGARVSVDGQQRGTSPLTVADLTPAEHRVTVTSAAGSAERTVSVTAGGIASVMFLLAKAPGPVGGWLTISAPFDIQLT